ncbi:MAG: bifunctional serine/threonine-protein kinase/formylglycine-generating enzyme family protein [Isosphaeraceae bacterium]
MLIFKKSSVLAVRHVFHPEALGTAAEVIVKDGVRTLGEVVVQDGPRLLGHAAEEAGAKVFGDWVKKLTERARNHFTDHSQALTEAPAEANEKPEVDRGRARGKTFRDQFARRPTRPFARGSRRSPGFGRLAGREPPDPERLSGRTPGGPSERASGRRRHVRPGGLADELGPSPSSTTPMPCSPRSCEAVTEVARELRRLGYLNLGNLLGETPTRGQPLLAMAVQFYFRRAVVDDEKLYREMTWVKAIATDRRLQEGFEFVTMLLAGQGERIDALLAGQAGMERGISEIKDAVQEAREAIRDGFDRLQRRPDGVSFDGPAEQMLLEGVKRKWRGLSEEERRRQVDLGLDVALLESAAGNHPGAWDPAVAVAPPAADPAAKARAFYEAHLKALRLSAWNDALTHLREAFEADADFALWPRNKYAVEGVLGAGGFGAAFVCWNNYKRRRVVLKSLQAASLDRSAAAIFHEAQALDRLGHPGIIALFDCGFGDERNQRYPYLEIEHFEGSLSLEEYVRKHGPLTVDDLLEVADRTAEALRAAHDAGYLHRDVKPGNLLIRRTATGWEVKVIDFGLSLRHRSPAGSQSQRLALSGSPSGYTAEYAAPEQRDPARSQEVGPHSDVFGFGRTCYFALFGEPEPDFHDIESIPKPWYNLLGKCAARKIDRRPRDFEDVLLQLRKIQGRGEESAHPSRANPDSLLSPPATLPSQLRCEEPRPTVSPYTLRREQEEPRLTVSAPLHPVADGPAPKPTAPARFTNSLGMTMVHIEPGEFLMGSTRKQIDLLLKQFPDAMRDWFDDEQPQHHVNITKPFYLAAHPVTVGQYRRFVEASGDKIDESWRKPGFRQGKDHPVVNVSYDDASKFVRWLNLQEKGQSRTYRLPTEAEWEYACRAGGKGVYGESDDPAVLDRVAWFDKNSRKATHQVGQKEANRLGLHDMLGNIWEWCGDFYAPDYYKNAPMEDPHSTAKSQDRVIRGGSWSLIPGYCRPADRYWKNSASRNSLVGFRVAAFQK